MTPRYRIWLTLGLLLAGSLLQAQTYKVKGTVYDSTRHFPMEYVTVLSSSGKGTMTNTEGRYEIEVGEKDSIWFSYLNKPTQKFPVLKILNPFAFDISLQVSITVMKEVKVRPRNYRQDSLQNRLDYAKVFNFEKPKIRTVTPQYGVGAGFDLTELINMFRFRRNRNMRSFQERLLQQEKDKYVDYRFSKALIRRLTSIDSLQIDSFRRVFRPSFFFTSNANDYDFQLYIRQSYTRFRMGLPPLSLFQKEEEEMEEP